MKNLESEFVKEFKSEVGVFESKDIYSVPLPKSCMGWYVSGRELYYVQGVEDEYFSLLNDNYVGKLPKGTVARKRVVDRANRCFRRDKEGNFVYSEVKLPKDSIVVTSYKNLSIPYGMKFDGYGYIDYVSKPEGMEFMYYMKKENLFKANQTALALSVKNMKNYSGMGYVTWLMGTVYLHVIPYHPGATYVGSKILKTGMSLNYGSEIREIIKYWTSINFIPNISLSEIENGNLVLKQTEVGYNEYIPYDSLSVGDREIYGSAGE